MFDFPCTEPSVYTALFSLGCWVILALNYYKFARYPLFSPAPQRKSIIIFVIGIYLIVNTLNGDFFHLMETIHNYNFTPDSWNYGEPIYGYFAFITNRNYLLFRTIVWGGAFVIFCLTAKRYKVPVYFAALLLLLLQSRTFVYARVTLAMAIFLYGYSFWGQKVANNKAFGYIVGTLIMYLSTFFHTSAWIMIAASIIFFIPLNKKVVIFAIILLPLILKYAQNTLTFIVSSGDYISDAQVSTRVTRAGTTEAVNLMSSPSGFVNTLIEFSNYYIPVILILINTIWKKTIVDTSNQVYKLVKLSTAFISLSFIFLLLGSQNMQLVVRIMLMSMLPSTILVGRLVLESKISFKHYKYILYLGMLYEFNSYLYALYCNIVKL